MWYKKLLITFTPISLAIPNSLAQNRGI